MRKYIASVSLRMSIAYNTMLLITPFRRVPKGWRYKHTTTVLVLLLLRVGNIGEQAKRLDLTILNVRNIFFERTPDLIIITKRQYSFHMVMSL